MSTLKTRDHSLQNEPGDHSVDAQVVCVITRFGLNRTRDLIGAFRDYKRVVSQARSSHNPGLLKSAFLVESPRTFCVLSIWSSYEAIPLFGSTVPIHVDAARRIFGHLKYDAATGPELWSTKWAIRSVSGNLRWGDFDFRGLLRANGEIGPGPVARAATSEAARL